MHPELLNNSLFLSYYQKWQRNPDSVVFASIAEYFLKYELVEDAFKVCKEGLKRHPNLAVARILMARIHLARRNSEAAEEELRLALKIAPDNMNAQNLLRHLQEKKLPSSPEIAQIPPERIEDNPIPSGWETITMAKIYSSQGHVDEARRIFKTILEREPENEEARQGLAAINS
jgi:tetratricopeptide (TPR) repeat protein